MKCTMQVFVVIAVLTITTKNLYLAHCTFLISSTTFKDNNNINKLISHFQSR